MSLWFAIFSAGSGVELQGLKIHFLTSEEISVPPCRMEYFICCIEGLKVVCAVSRKLFFHFEIVYDFFEKKIGSI